MLKRVFLIGTWVVALSGWGFALYFFLYGQFRSQPSSAGIEYKDFVSMLLTALGVMVAVLAAVLALGAVWGFAMIREETIKAAKTEATKVANQVSKDVADSVATRIALGAAPTTSKEDATEIAKAMNGESDAK